MREYIDTDQKSIIRDEEVNLGPRTRPIPTSIRGWMWSWELHWLYEKALALRGGILEIGSYAGLSASALGQAGPLTCVDTFQDCSVEEFDGNMKLMGLSPVVIAMPSDAAFPLLESQMFQLILIDGSHEYPQVKRDIDHSIEHLEPGGVLVADDYYGSPGVERACREVGGFVPVRRGTSKMAMRQM